MMISSSGNFIQKTTRKNPKVSVVLGAYMVELQVMTGKDHREISLNFPNHGELDRKDVPLMLIRIGQFDFTECWDGVLYKNLSNYPEITDWEIQSVLDFVKYESKY